MNNRRVVKNKEDHGKSDNLFSRGWGEKKRNIFEVYKPTPRSSFWKRYHAI